MLHSSATVGLLLALVVTIMTLGSSRATGPHLSGSSCPDCHLANEVSKDNAAVLKAGQEKLCGGCHAKAIQLSHPSGFAPKRPLPPDFPLDWKGDLTCSSCHDVHSEKAGLMRGQAQGLDFCLACHPQTFFDGMADRGVSMAASGHLDARANPNGVELDTFSLQCMSCHGDEGNTQQVGISDKGYLRHFGSSMNHPIGGLYANAIKSGGYRDAAVLPRQILLPDGRIGCVSCHVGYSKKHGGLVISNEGSNLCFSCHNL